MFSNGMGIECSAQRWIWEGHSQCCDNFIQRLILGKAVHQQRYCRFRMQDASLVKLEFES